ncbi:MAG: hypothetical protein ACOYU7_07705 [Bacillota bacterium]
MERIKKALDGFDAEILKILRKFERDLIKWMFIFSVGQVVVVLAAVLAMLDNV